MNKTNKIQVQRLQFERENLEENQDSIPPNCKYKFESDHKLVVQYIGLKGEPHEGAYIVVDIDLSNFPQAAPIITFRNEFKHVNVYPLGKLCMYLTNAETFVSGTTLVEILSGINQVIHKPTFADPANTSIMLNDGGKGYDEKMRDQAKRLSDPKYKVL